MDPIQPLKDLLRNQLKDYLVKKALEALLKKLGFLSWGPFALIAEFVVEKIVNEIVDLSIMTAMVAYIRYDVDSDVTELEQIVIQIHEKAKQQELTIDEIHEFDKEIARIASDLIRMRPNTTK